MKYLLVKLFLIAYSVIYIGCHFDLEIYKKLINNFPLFEIFDMFFKQLPENVHITILFLGGFLLVLHFFRLFRKLTSFVLKLVGYVIIFLLITLIFYVVQFLY